MSSRQHEDDIHYVGAAIEGMGAFVALVVAFMALAKIAVFLWVLL